MVMMGIEFTGKLPFSTIYLHGLVRDSQVKHNGTKSFNHFCYLMMSKFPFAGS